MALACVAGGACARARGQPPCAAWPLQTERNRARKQRLLSETKLFEEILVCPPARHCSSPLLLSTFNPPCQSPRPASLPHHPPNNFLFISPSSFSSSLCHHQPSFTTHPLFFQVSHLVGGQHTRSRFSSRYSRRRPSRKLFW